MSGESWVCPKCGSTQGVQVGRRVNGWETWHIMGDGSAEIVDDVHLRRSLPKTGRCLECGRRVPTPLRTHERQETP